MIQQLAIKMGGMEGKGSNAGDAARREISLRDANTGYTRTSKCTGQKCSIGPKKRKAA
jgi:hypothetical protein